MLIKMKETQKGSPNGLVVNTYEKGNEYDLPESLANVFLKIGACEMVKVPSNKDAGSSSENKDKDKKDKGKKKEDEEDSDESSDGEDEEASANKKVRRK